MRKTVEYYEPKTDKDVEGTLVVEGTDVTFTWDNGEKSYGNLKDATTDYPWVDWSDEGREMDESMEDIIGSYL